MNVPETSLGYWNSVLILLCLSSKPELSEFIYHTFFFLSSKLINSQECEQSLKSGNKTQPAEPPLRIVLAFCALGTHPSNTCLRSCSLLSFPVRKAVYGCSPKNYFWLCKLVVSIDLWLKKNLTSLLKYFGSESFNSCLELRKNDIR